MRSSVGQRQSFLPADLSGQKPRPGLGRGMRDRGRVMEAPWGSRSHWRGPLLPQRLDAVSSMACPSVLGSGVWGLPNLSGLRPPPPGRRASQGGTGSWELPDPLGLAQAAPVISGSCPQGASGLGVQAGELLGAVSAEVRSWRVDTWGQILLCGGGSSTSGSTPGLYPRDASSTPSRGMTIQNVPGGQLSAPAANLHNRGVPSMLSPRGSVVRAGREHPGGLPGGRGWRPNRDSSFRKKIVLGVCLALSLEPSPVFGTKKMPTEWLNGWMDGRADGWMGGWMGERARWTLQRTGDGCPGSRASSGRGTEAEGRRVWELPAARSSSTEEDGTTAVRPRLAKPWTPFPQERGKEQAGCGGEASGV